MNSELDKLEVKQEPTVSLVLDLNEINVILAGLQELPHKFSNAVINKIMTEANNQVKPE